MYIGSHGNSEGLKPSRNSKVTLTWSRLAQVLGAAKSPIWVCLGACESTFAAAAWSKYGPDFPVSTLLGFETDNTTEDEVGDVLLKLLEVTGFYGSGSKEIRIEREEITTIEQDLSFLKESSSRLLVYRRMPETGGYSTVSDSSAGSEPVVSDVDARSQVRMRTVFWKPRRTTTKRNFDAGCALSLHPVIASNRMDVSRDGTKYRTVEER
jgi:hypothetical protein